MSGSQLGLIVATAAIAVVKVDPGQRSRSVLACRI